MSVMRQTVGPSTGAIKARDVAPPDRGRPGSKVNTWVAIPRGLNGGDGNVGAAHVAIST